MDHKMSLFLFLMLGHLAYAATLAPDKCGFESDLCGWSASPEYESGQYSWKRQDLATWTGRTHETETIIVASGGKTAGQGVAQISSPHLKKAPQCFSFAFAATPHLKELNVFVEDVITGNKKLVWNLTEENEKDAEWHFANAFLPKEEGTNRLSLEAVPFEDAGGLALPATVALDDLSLRPEEDPVRCQGRPQGQGHSRGQRANPGRCDFTTDTCGWVLAPGAVADPGFRWQRRTAQQLKDEGVSGPATGESQGMKDQFLFVSASYGTKNGSVAELFSPIFEGMSAVCFHFTFDLPQSGLNLDIYAKDELTQARNLVWTDNGNQFTGWEVGRAKVASPTLAEKFRIQIVATRGTGGIGYAALDTVHFSTQMGACTQDPPDTNPPTPPPTQPYEENVLCTFEEADLCSWTATPSASLKKFHFFRTNGYDVAVDHLLGPHVDHVNEDHAHFMLADASKGESGATARGQRAQLASLFFNVDEHPSTCFHFWYSLQHDRAINAFVIETRSRNHVTEVVWNLIDPPVTEGLWNEAQVLVGPEDGTDFQVLVSVIRGTTANGYVAVDDFFFVNRDPCQLLPPEAEPVLDPHITEILCSFETATDLCGWTLPDSSIFVRQNGEAVSPDSPNVHGPESDLHSNPKGWFLVADGTPDADQTTQHTNAKLESPYFSGTKNELECFQFWFLAEHQQGFSSIHVFLTGFGDSFTIWEYDNPSNSPQWTQAEMTVKAHHKKDYKLLIVVDQDVPGPSFVAIDELAFTNADRCAYLPANSSHLTTRVPVEIATYSDNGRYFWFEDLQGNDVSKRPSLVDAGAPVHGHNGVSDYQYFYLADATMSIAADTKAKAWLLTNTFDGLETHDNCVHFWFDYRDPESITSISVNLDGTLSGTTKALVWQENHDRDESGQLIEGWREAQFMLRTRQYQNYSMEFVARRGPESRGFVTVDDIEMEDKPCSHLPEDSVPGLTCNFQSNYCSWTDSSPLPDRWMRRTGQEVEDEGLIGPVKTHDGKNDRGFILVRADVSKPGESGQPQTVYHRAQLTSQLALTGSQRRVCLHFWYNMGGGGIDSLSFSAGPYSDPSEQYAGWHLKYNQELMLLGEWQMARLELKADDDALFDVFITAVQNSAKMGYAAIDDIVVNSLSPCSTIPIEAAPDPDSMKEGLCTFEREDLCGWLTQPFDSRFHFQRVNGLQVSSDTALNGPTSDAAGSADRHFMLADAASSSTIGQRARIYSKYFNATEHPYECFHFSYSIQHEDSIQGLYIETQTATSAPEIVWSLRNTPSSDDKVWREGQAMVGPKDGRDFMISVTAVRGGHDVGFVAVDDFIFFDMNPCIIIPAEAKPSKEPTFETVLCSFETDFCGWARNAGDVDAGDFTFSRFTGKTLSEQPEAIGPHIDFQENDEGWFALVQAQRDKPEGQATLTSPPFNAKLHDRECLEFWYSTQHQKGIEAIVVSTTANTGFVDVWRLTNPKSTATDAWTRARMTVKARDMQDYQIKVTVVRTTPETGFFAIDEIQFTHSDTCGTLPVSAEVPESKLILDNWTFDSTDSGFSFTSASASDISSQLSHGPHTNSQGSQSEDFFNVDATETNVETAKAFLISDNLLGAEQDRTCLIFWYALENTYGIQSLFAEIDSASERPVYSLWEVINPPLAGETSHDVWAEGRAMIKTEGATNFTIRFTAHHGLQPLGYASLDDFIIIDHSKDCTQLPRNSRPTVSCDFDIDYCTWTQASKDSWSRTSGQENEDNQLAGPTEDREHRKDGYFLTRRATMRNEYHQSRLTNLVMSYQQECLEFWYYFEGEGGIDWLAISLSDANNPVTEEVPWMLKYKDLEESEKKQWNFAQLPIGGADPALLEIAIKTVQSSDKTGSISIDGIKTEALQCSVHPSKAGGSASPYDAVTCNFEDGSLCGWNQPPPLSPFTFHAASGRNLTADQVPGPRSDHDGQEDAMFLVTEDLRTIEPDASTELFTDDLPGVEKSFCFEFFFNMLKEQDTNGLRIHLKNQLNREETLLWEWNRPTVDWQKGRVRVDGHEPFTEPVEGYTFQIILEAYRNQKDLTSYVAVDDFSFMEMGSSAECKTLPQDAEPGVVCPSERDMPCLEDNTCIPWFKVCDFIKDCSTGRDEEICPRVFTFDACPPGVPMCYWSNKKLSQHLNWKVIGSGPETAAHGPLNHPTKFLYLVNTGVNGTTDYISDNPILASPTYRNSGPQCSLRFNLFEDGDLGPGGVIWVVMEVNERAFAVEEFPPTPLMGWRERQTVFIGRRKGEFRIRFEKSANSVYDAGVAVDDVVFDKCDLPQPSASTGNCPVGQTKCKNGVCIPNEQMCDFSDDCGDSSDETATSCKGYTIYSFETDDTLELFEHEDPKAELKWKRGDAADTKRGSAPPFDHTLLSPEAHFLYLDTSEATSPASVTNAAGIVTRRTIKPRPVKEACKARFYYQQYGGTAILQTKVVSTSSQQEVSSAAFAGPVGPLWTRVEIEASHITDEVNLLLEAKHIVNGRGYVAVDDFSFTPECEFGDDHSPTTTESSKCPDWQYQCNDGTCLGTETICNFKHDCAGGEDEDHCPAIFNFAHCDPLADCDWINDVLDEVDWEVWSYENFSISGFNHHGPSSNPIGSQVGQMAFLTNQGGLNDYTQVNTLMHSPRYQDSASSCTLFFNYYLSGNTFGKSFLVKMNVKERTGEDEDEVVETFLLDRIETTGREKEDNKWKEAKITLGRRQQEFDITFSMEMAKSFDTALALDEVGFLHCNIPSPAEDPQSCTDKQFQCGNTGACIDRQSVCDLSDDCGDKADEADSLCSGVLATNFEKDLGHFLLDVHAPLSPALFTRGGPNQFKEFQGPPFDHSTWSTRGHYVFLDTKGRRKNDQAWLVSKPFDGPGKCLLTMWIHLKGSRQEVVTVYLQDINMRLINPMRSNLVQNQWTSVKFNLEMKQSLRFRAIIEVKVTSDDSDSVVSLDDLVFHEGCKPFNGDFIKPVSPDDQSGEGGKSAWPFILLGVVTAVVVVGVGVAILFALVKKDKGLGSSTIGRRIRSILNPNYAGNERPISMRDLARRSDN